MRPWLWCSLALACADADSPVPNGGDRAVVDSGRAVVAPAADSSLPTVLLVGTSLTAGLGLDPDEAYPAILQRKADSAGYRVNIVAAGVSGETSAGALRRIDWLLQRPADVVVIETGANDGLRGLDIDSTRANLREILRRSAAARPSARLFLVQMEAPPNLGPRYTSRFRSMFPEVAAAEGAQLIPFILDGVAGLSSMNQSDGIHPNLDGSQRVAANMWATLQPTLQALNGPPAR
jgi:acyl-CoA thioesterase I